MPKHAHAHADRHTLRAGQPLRSPMRWAASAMMLVAAAVHVPLVPDHLREAPYIGVLFIALAVTGAVLTVALVIWDTPWVWALSGLVTFVSLVAFVASRTIGLPELADDIGNWTEPLGFPALVSEAVVTVAAVLALRRHHQLPRRNAS